VVAWICGVHVRGCIGGRVIVTMIWARSDVVPIPVGTGIVISAMPMTVMPMSVTRMTVMPMIMVIRSCQARHCGQRNNSKKARGKQREKTFHDMLLPIHDRLMM